MTSRCSVCALPPHLLSMVNQMLHEGTSAPGVEQYIRDKGHPFVSVHSVYRHKKNHVTEQETTDPTPSYERAFDQAPPETPRVEMEGDSGTIQTGGIDKIVTDYNGLLDEFGIDSTVFQVVGPVRTSRWQRYDGKWLTSYRFRFEKIRDEETFDLPATIAEFKNVPKFSPSSKNQSQHVTKIVNIADMQIGKVDSRGTTEDLLSRLQMCYDALEADYKKLQTQGIVPTIIIADVGDAIENFQNVASQMFSNDLSLMKQLDLANYVFAWFINQALRYSDDVRYVAVPSNHCAWRKGKNYINNDPNDDWGIYCARQIERTYGDRVKVYIPVDGSYDKIVTIAEPGGLTMAFTHGDDFSPARWKQFFSDQTFLSGRQELLDASLLIYAHYHNLSLATCGVTPDQKQRWAFCCPTLDNGSSWFRQKTGEHSQAGLSVLTVKNGTFNPGNISFYCPDEM